MIALQVEMMTLLLEMTPLYSEVISHNLKVAAFACLTHDFVVVSRHFIKWSDNCILLSTENSGAHDEL